jgi:acetylglutamate synthase
MVAEWPKLIWRSRADNPINEFYFRESDGSVRKGRWIVFWTGFKTLTEVSPLVEEVAKLPATLEDKAA